MALPAEFNTVQVYGTYLNLDGTPVVGYLTFEASPIILKATASKDFIVPVVLQVNLDINGAFSINLPVTDDPDINPSDWTYKVTEGFGSRRVYNVQIHIAQSPSVNMYDIAPVELADGTFYLQGAPGPAGPPAIITSGQPAGTVGGDGQYAIDPATGILYKNTSGVWDNGTHLAAADVAAHAALTQTHGIQVGSALVGTTDSQTLSNKTLQTPTITGGVTTDSAHATDNVQIDGSLTVTGAATLPSITGPVTVTGNETVTGQLTVQGSTTLAGTTLTGNLDLGTHDATVHNLTASSQVSAPRVSISGTPTATTDAATKGYVDSTAGDTNASVSTLVRRDAAANIFANLVSGVAAPTAANHLTRKDYVDGVGVSAPTVSTIMRRDASGRAQVVDPAAAADVATKNYVDTTTVSTTASTVTLSGSLSAAGLASSSYLDLSYLTPANPAVNTGRLYVDATTHALTMRTSSGSVKTGSAYWGAVTAFPTAFMQAGDTCLRTDLGSHGSLWHFTGDANQGSSGWVVENRIVCTSTTRPTTALYNGLQIHETDTGRTYVYLPSGTTVLGSALAAALWDQISGPPEQYSMASFQPGYISIATGGAYRAITVFKRGRDCWMLGEISHSSAGLSANTTYQWGTLPAAVMPTPNGGQAAPVTIYVGTGTTFVAGAALVLSDGTCFINSSGGTATAWTADMVGVRWLTRA